MSVIIRKMRPQTAREPVRTTGATQKPPAERHMLPRLLSTEDVGQVTGRSARTIRGWIEGGKLAARKRNGRFYVTQDELFGFLDLGGTSE